VGRVFACSLKRMYIDRIINPTVPVSEKDFSCSKGHLLGVKVIYEKEKRLAFRLIPNSVTKKITKIL
jgi:hypothetical protein